MDKAKQQLIEKLKTANNVLVTVSKNPTVDQLAALIGFSLVINKQGKHCAAVFSGQVPSTLEFLRPEETIEKTTDSLRDFIIALDKNKADKLRYKVEDNIVRIFITPYKTSITQEDLEFSQGDFNVDLLVALGVKEQSDLDVAITAHGRILHDAVVATINLDSQGDLGTINWTATGSSSLCEAVTDLTQSISDKIIDNQLATALLTGIVAETDRFRNEKTTPQTMSLSAVLMKDGANQQLIASKLEESLAAQPSSNENTQTQTDQSATPASPDGTLQIEHEKTNKPIEAQDKTEPISSYNPIVDNAVNNNQSSQSSQSNLTPGPKIITEPPTLGGTLTANSQPNEIEPTTDPFSQPQKVDAKILEKTQPDIKPLAEPDTSTTQPVITIDNASSAPTFTPPPQGWQPPNVSDDQTNLNYPQIKIDEEGTLSDIEEAVHSPHIKTENPTTPTESAREEVNKAIDSVPTQIDAPIQALNATPLGPDLHKQDTVTLADLEKDIPKPDNQATTAPPVPPPIYNPPKSP
ncbi:MAG TPA: hypothetical protein VLF63_00700 [Patescibacteria group bacterium]|nr:hypothetical protein [Patescibacteria group bacterium]